jgi:hypothetical protein
MTGRGNKFLGEYKSGDARIDHVIQVMQDMPEYKNDQIIKIIDTLAEPIPKKTNSSFEEELSGIAKLNKNEDDADSTFNEEHRPRQS